MGNDERELKTAYKDLLKARYKLDFVNTKRANYLTPIGTRRHRQLISHALDNTISRAFLIDAPRAFRGHFS